MPVPTLVSSYATRISSLYDVAPEEPVLTVIACADADRPTATAAAMNYSCVFSFTLVSMSLRVPAFDESVFQALP